MAIETLIQAGTLISVFVGVFGLGVAIRTYKRQTNAQVFLEYTSRYERIMESFPSEAIAVRLNLEAEPPLPDQRLQLAVLRYLNLCSEEYYLWKRGYLANEVWLIWETELRRTLRSRLYKREWRALRPEFEAFPEFLTYVDTIQGES